MTRAEHLLVVLGICAGASLAHAQQQFLRLDDRSTLFHEVCLSPCACPITGQVEPMSGGLVLITEVSQPPFYFRYRVQQVRWSSESPRGRDVLTGSGILEVFGDFVLQRRLQLDLTIENLPETPIQHFDTGMVTGNVPLDATAEQFGCQRLTISVLTTDRCPADFNADAQVNADDLGDFITGYFASPPDPRCEFNFDGAINPDDLGDFITAYFTEPC